MSWFTIVCQILNFLVLIALLKFLLYKRIVQAMDTRQATIAASIRAAEEKEQQAGEEVATYSQKNREFEDQRVQMLEAAKQDADMRRKELTSQAQEDVAALQARWQRAVREESDQFVQQLRESIGRHACQIARRALADMADADLGDRVAGAFLHRLREVDDATRRELIEALKDPNGSVTVVSAFDVRYGANTTSGTKSRAIRRTWGMRVKNRRLFLCLLKGSTPMNATSTPSMGSGAIDTTRTASPRATKCQA